MKLEIREQETIKAIKMATKEINDIILRGKKGNVKELLKLRKELMEQLEDILFFVK